MLRNEDYTALFYHLREFFSKQALGERSFEILQQEEDELIRIIRQASSKIVIPPSGLDDTAREIIFTATGVIPVEDQNGLNMDISSLPEISDELYKLTVLGEIESQLSKYVIETLRDFLKDIETAVNEEEAEYNRMVDKAWERYQEEIREFNEGDYGYDYDGAIMPEAPAFSPFDRRAAIAKRIDEIETLNLDDPKVVLQTVSVEKGLMGDLLHEHFEDCEFIDDIVKNLKLTGLNAEHILHFLKTKDFYFPDCDILKRGFLLDIFIENIQHDFKKDRPRIDVDEHISVLFKAMSSNPVTAELITNYNLAVANNDNLKLQRIWFYISAFCKIVEKALKNKPVDLDKLSKELFAKYNDIQQKHGETLKSLIKVFPADTADTLFYPGIATTDNQSHYPSSDAKLPLRPLFHTLELIARNTHAKLVEAGSTAVESTNVVSAMLCFVVSTTTDKDVALTGRISNQLFIKVPLNFDYRGTVLVSIDEAFKDKNDLETSIGTDLESGTRIAGRMVSLPIDEEKSAKATLLRLLDTLKIDDLEKEHMITQIEIAEVAAPVTLDYYMSSDVGKSTEHRHSERVLNRALKEPKNIEKIIASIKTSMQEQGITKSGVYTIHSGALLVYSYPNSVCDPCGISFLALQNSYEQGFLAEFINRANTNDPASIINLRTRGFNPKTREQNPDEFGITVIAASNKIFAKDSYAALVANAPEVKYTCHTMPYMHSNAGINLRNQRLDTGRDRFYEYTANSQLHMDSNVSVPYAGTIFMSGSKESKISSARKRTQLESAVKDVVKTCDTSVKAGFST